MNELTAEWIEKAEGDFNTAKRELRARKNPNFDAACFHCQQYAVKYLKAFLQNHDHAFPKIHDLPPLLRLCMTYDPLLEALREALTILDKYSVRFRYPGFDADKEEAKLAVKNVKSVREMLRSRLDMTD
jgi:HEPN domain-containing protein